MYRKAVNRKKILQLLFSPFSLDLDAWINEPPSESESEDEKPKAVFAKEEPKHSRSRHTEVDEKELARVSVCSLSDLQKMQKYSCPNTLACF